MEVDDAVVGNVQNVGAYEVQQHEDVDSGPVEVGRVAVDILDLQDPCMADDEVTC